jgi:transposase
LDEEQLVWIDECGVEQGLYRLHARSPRGVPVLVDVQDKRFAPRINVIAAYNQHRLYATLRLEGSIDTAIFNTWVEACLVPNLCPGQVVIMDNARFHQSAKTRELIEGAKCQLLFQPAYSPDLNKIEPQWAVLKQGIRANSDPDLPFLEKLDQQLIYMYEP